MLTNVENKTIHEFFDEMVKKYPQRQVLVVGESRDTFLQFQSKVNALAAGLQKHGIQKGDKVGINLPTCAENAYAFFALFKIGASFVPLNPALRSYEVKHILGDSNAKAVFTVSKMNGFDFLSMFDEIRVDLPNFETIFTLESDTKNDAIPINDLLVAEPGDLKPVSVSPDDIACILYTSGTTGLPKGTVHTHRILLDHFAMFLDGEGQDQLHTFLTALPLFNAAGVQITIQMILKGDCLVLIQRYHPAEVIKIIKSEEVTKISFAPTMVKVLLNVEDFNQQNLPSLRVISTGGSMATQELVQAIKDHMDCEYENIYASTEAGIISRLSPSDSLDLQLTTVGRPLNGVKVKIIDDKGDEVPFNNPGEIAVSSPSLMAGYFNDHAKTKETIDQDGYYYTGDIGSLDENGYLRILDRKKDVIIRGAQNIYPSEIENYLNTHPKIQMSAVIGVPSPISGEKVRAYVQLFEGEQLTDIEVVEYCRGEIAGYKIPEEVHFIEEFPLNKMGKIQKKVLREEAYNG